MNQSLSLINLTKHLKSVAWMQQKTYGLGKPIELFWSGGIDNGGPLIL